MLFLLMIIIGGVMYFGVLPLIYGVTPQLAADAYFSDMSNLILVIPWVFSFFMLAKFTTQALHTFWPGNAVAKLKISFIQVAFTFGFTIVMTIGMKFIKTYIG